jgi:hypothetical protein
MLSNGDIVCGDAEGYDQLSRPPGTRAVAPALFIPPAHGHDRSCRCRNALQDRSERETNSAGSSPLVDRLRPEEIKMRSIMERLQRGVTVLLELQQKRIETGDPKLGYDVEQSIIETELRDLVLLGY